MVIVLDTNVLVSGLLKGNSKPGTIVKLVAAGQIKLAYDARIIAEYRQVLKRPKFAFRQSNIEALIKVIESEGVMVTAKPMPLTLPDEGDRPFIEVACTLKEAQLVTGSRKHFPHQLDLPLTSLDPAEYLDRLVL
jgi:uncharacterized protein